MRWVRALSALVLVLVLAGLPAAADAPAKGKKVSCKGAKIPVTVGKRTTCVPIGKALPKPKAVDVRVADLKGALQFDRFGAAGKRAQKKFLAVLPKALARIDRAAASRSVLLEDEIATASACAANGVLDQEGSVAGVGIAAAGDNGGQLTIRTGGSTYKLRFASCGGSTGLYVPECPTAAGDVSARTSGKFEITEELLDGDRVVSRRNISFETKGKARGKVAADAKLDYVVIDWERETFIVATGGIVQRGKTERHVRIDMRSGKYDASDASLKVTGDAKTTDDAESFAGVVKDAIKDFRFAENGGDFLHTDGWATFNRKRGAYCAEPVFSPASETLKLKKGKGGQLGIYAKARSDGGKAAGAKWTLLAPVNASFDPGSSEQAQPSISYTVTNAPPGGKVQVTVKFTSTAGVGEKTWAQPTEPGEAINHIEGSFGGELSQATSIGVPIVQKWSGVASFDRLGGGGSGAAGFYLLSSGNASIELSGTEGSGITGCRQSGSGQAPVTSGSMIVTGTGPDEAAPYTYSVQIAMPFLTLKGTRHTCPSGASAWEGTEFDATPLWGLDVNGQSSADGLAYVDSLSENFGSPPFVSTFERHWTLHGKP